MKNRIAGAIVLALGLLLPNDALPQIDNPRAVPGPSEPEVRLPSGKIQREEILKADYEKTLQNAAQLVKLSEELQDDLIKEDRHVLSLASLKKAEDIEKLARKIRTRLKK